MVNVQNPLLYEHLSLIISEYETAALKSNKREPVLAISNSSLSAMDFILASSEKSLKKVKDTRTQNSIGPVQAEANLVNLDLDADVGELFADSNNPVANYIQECLGCDFRVKFDWQVKPLNLLGGIENLLGQIKTSIDGFQFQLDPNKSLDKICELLNSLKGLCLPDIIIVLLSVKMLLKKYVGNAFNFKIDWTTIVGPLLKAIVEGISSLLENLSMVMLAPLDCVISNLQAAKSIQSSLNQLSPSNLKIKSEGSVNEKGIGIINPGPDTRIFTEFSVSASTTLETAMQNPAFGSASILDKATLAVNDARKYIADLLNQILKGLDGVQALVGSGFSAQLGNLGIILFLQDLISLIMVIINLMKSKKNVTDWCQTLNESPEILESAIQARYNPNLKVQSTNDGTLKIFNGPKLVTEIRTCARAQTESDKNLLQQWIQELELKGI